MSKNKQAQILDGYWVVGTNKWDASIYTKEQSEKYADTLNNCTDCVNCSYCRGCRDCSSCRDCSHCSYCSYCSGCRDCRGCRDCSSCSYCRGCSYCSYCSYCSDFKENPERITSRKIGSRHQHTTYYWTKDHEQIVCGYFTGTLLEFEAKVEKTHGDNQHAKDYFNFIERVKLYIQQGNK